MNRTSKEFATPEGLKKYLQEHPQADASKHTVQPNRKPNKSLGKALENLGWAGTAVKQVAKQLQGQGDIDEESLRRAIGELQIESKNLKNYPSQRADAAHTLTFLRKYQKTASYDYDRRTF